MPGPQLSPVASFTLPVPLAAGGTTAARGQKAGKGSVGETAAWGGWGRPPGRKEEDPPERAAGRRLRTA